MIKLDQVSTIEILQSHVHMVEISDVVQIMDQWIETEPDQCHYVVNTGMHGIMEGHRDPEFRGILNSADLFAPDGILLVLLARLRGYPIRKKNTGPDLLWEFSHIANEKAYSYFIYGDTEETLQLLAIKLLQAFPHLKIVGLHSPPFRALTSEEDEAVIENINKAAPDVLWVGLGAPKQERWIYEHRHRLRVPIVVGAGASLKFSSGKVGRAPAWLRNYGFEWLWRLFQEPRRVWRRVLIDAPQFLWLIGLELLGRKK